MGHRTGPAGSPTLAVAERMSSLGTLAAGVAHEINNPLTYVITNIEVARAAIGTVPCRDALVDSASALDDALDGAHRVRRLVHDLRTYARSTEQRVEPTDVTAVVDTAVKLARHQLEHLGRLTVRCAPVPKVAASDARLVQVVLNLMINAGQALPEGAADRNEIEVCTLTGADGRVGITVRDTGCGIAADALPRIFDPFYTTKPIGVGTGLGLFICHGIISALGGELTVDSQPGRGTTFAVWLPALTDGAGAGQLGAAAAPAPPARAGLRVLVIDDDARVGRSIVRLARGVHEVTAVTSARDALGRLTAGERFDLILCDIMMPEMDGPEFHAALAAQDRARADGVVFMTGGTFTARAQEFIAGRPGPTLEKPFSRTTLLAVIADASGPHAAAPTPPS